MKLIITKEERESAGRVQETLISLLESEGIATSSQNVVDDYKKGISTFRDEEGNTVVDIKTAFIMDIVSTFKKVGILFIRTAIPFAKACHGIEKLMSDLDDRWTDEEAPLEKANKIIAQQNAARAYGFPKPGQEKPAIGFVNTNSKEVK